MMTVIEGFAAGFAELAGCRDLLYAKKLVVSAVGSLNLNGRVTYDPFADVVVGEAEAVEAVWEALKADYKAAVAAKMAGKKRGAA
ncbi:MAG: hypothetical protein ACPLRM_08845 [Anaerolineae bacterium]